MHKTQYEAQSPQWHNHQTFLLLWTFLLNHTLIRVVSSIITVSAFVCSYFVFVPCSRMSSSCALLLSEASLFVIRMEDSFDFHVGKRLASHPFGFDTR